MNGFARQNRCTASAPASRSRSTKRPIEACHSIQVIRNVAVARSVALATLDEYVDVIAADAFVYAARSPSSHTKDHGMPLASAKRSTRCNSRTSCTKYDCRITRPGWQPHARVPWRTIRRSRTLSGSEERPCQLGADTECSDGSAYADAPRKLDAALAASCAVLTPN